MGRMPRTTYLHNDWWKDMALHKDGVGQLVNIKSHTAAGQKQGQELQEWLGNGCVDGLAKRAAASNGQQHWFAKLKKYNQAATLLSTW
eukprot:242538-Prorocentrum_lima.AAC.1